ncbi:hypothetical protein, partial [Staphylococcus epidermidis]|uniref:hypothetical protein n=1 Tax=Staphylococcus epidermidis TaxID=1282 RepID=UPI001C931B6C
NDWKELENKVEEYGVYEGYRLGIGRSESICYVENGRSCVMGIVEEIEGGRYGNGERFHGMGFL